MNPVRDYWRMASCGYDVKINVYGRKMFWFSEIGSGVYDCGRKMLGKGDGAWRILIWREMLCQV